MKKVIAILISTGMVLGLVACGNKAETTTREEITTENTAEDTAEKDTAAIEEDIVANDSTSGSENVMEEDKILEANETNEVAETMDVTENKNGGEAPDNINTQGGKILVAYFSATNTTEGVAQRIANGMNADIYEIVPEEPYTDADLNYNDNNSRTTIEMNDPNARPAIAGSVENMEQYDIVFIGYPIWWGEAPRIMSTFVESYDFSGKTIVPFCTSGGSGVGSSASNLEQLTSGAEWLAGTRLGGSDSQEKIMEWVNDLALNLGE